MWKLRLGQVLSSCLLAMLVMLLALTPRANATPWLEANDVQLRLQLQTLVDAGVLRASAGSLPLLWSALVADLHAVDVRRLSARELLAYSQLVAALEFHRSGGYTGGRIGMQSENGASSSYGSPMQELLAVELTREFQGEHSAGRIQTTFRTRRDDIYGRTDHELVSFAGSYLATMVSVPFVGDWALSVDQVATWWSPTYAHNGLHVRSQQPLQSVRLNRAEAAQSELPLLRWLGPWSASAYVGRAERKIPHAQANDALIREQAFGARITLQPFSQTQIGARFTGSHLDFTQKVAALDIRVVSPWQFSAGQLAAYGEVITANTDKAGRWHSLGVDYAFVFAGNNAKVFVEALELPGQRTHLLGWQQFAASGVGVDVRLSGLRYATAVDSAPAGSAATNSLPMNSTLQTYARNGVIMNSLLAQNPDLSQRTQLDIALYMPYADGRLHTGVQFWQDRLQRTDALAAIAADETEGRHNRQHINVFINYELRW